MSESKESLIHCKKCRGLVVKDLDASKMTGCVSFSIRCPHCKADQQIKIEMITFPFVSKKLSESRT